MDGDDKNNGLIITDPEHALIKMGDDLKLGNVSQFQDLIVEVLKSQTEENNVYQSPNLYINMASQEKLDQVKLQDGIYDLGKLKPTLAKSDIQCFFYGEELCVISGKEILDKNASLILIGVFCKDKCTFRLKSDLEVEVNLKPGKMHQVYFSENQQRIFRFQIPQDDSIENIEIRGTSDSKFGQFQMLVLQGNEVPSSSNGLTLQPAWENGYVGKFERMSWQFCTGCNYTVLVSAKTAGYLTLGAKVSNATIDLNSFKDGETYDYVHFWGLQCYSYFVSDPQKPFTIKVQNYGGNPLIYVNPLVELDQSNFQKALFNSMDHFQNEELVLDYQLREKNNASIGMYYICIYGLSSTSYKISAKNVDHTNMLKAGLLESGYIERDEIKEFYFTDKVLRDESIKVQLKTNVMVGSVRIKSKICPRSSADITESIAECYFTPKEMKEEEENENIFQNAYSISELPQHNICAPDKFYISQDLGNRKDGEAGCILVFGVLGLSESTTHFSVMLQLEDGQGKSHPLILSQGVPDFQKIKRSEKQYYQITIEDPDIQRLTILLTSIHGNPDLFISTTTTNPSDKDFEWASYNAGLFPDMVVIKKQESDDQNLTKNYYVTVQSLEDSTYSLVYYTHNSKNEAGIQKLLVGKKQRGVLHLPDNITQTVQNQTNFISKEVEVGQDFTPQKSEQLPSLIYHFQVSAFQLAHGKVVRISLNVENGGDLMYLVKANSVPELSQDYKNITDDHWVGYNYRDVLIKLEELDQKLKQDVQDSQNTTNQLIDFYIRIYPRTIFVFDPDNKNKQPIVFTISFFDEEQFIHLQDGVPYRGALTNQAPDFFYFDIQDLNVDYEISLNAISGGYSELHLTLDPNNKFMRDQKSMLTSANRFTTDSIILTKEMIAHAIENGYGINFGEKQIKTILQVYIQVNTSDTLSVYSILFSKLSEFNAIQLTLGQVQQSSVKPNEKKIYYLTVHSSSTSKPLRIDLYPSNGQPEIEVTVLSNKQFSELEISDLLKQPTFKQKIIRGEETLLIDLNKNENLQCKQNCVIIISISDKSIDPEKMVQSHYRLQVSQDFQELVDGEPVQGQINILKQNCTHFGQYMFYRFYKPCGSECDFVLHISPDQILENVLSVLVNFEDPSDLASGEQTNLPTWQSKPTWSIGVKSPTVITIEGTEPYFQERTQGVSSSGKVLSGEQERSSIGYFIIGIQSYVDVSFKIKGGTVLSGSDEKIIDIQQLYVGTQQRPVYLKPGQSKYFFFRNWREESITFSLDFQAQNMWDNVQMIVSQLESGDSKSGHGSGGRIPKTLKELESRIVQDFEPLIGEFIEINSDSDQFCYMCMYLIKVINMNDIMNTAEGDAKFNIEVQQSLDDLSDEVITKHEGTFLQSFLQIGRPQPLNLQKYDKIKLQFQTSKELKIDLETRLGSVQVRLERDQDGKLLQNYTQSRKTLIQLNITNEDLKNIILDNDGEFWGDSSTKFNLIVTADSNDFEGSVLVRDPNALSILPDGKTIDLYFDYGGDKTKGTKRNGRYHQIQYFMLIPSSHNMDLQIQAGLKTFSSQEGTFDSEGTLIEIGQTSLREQLLDPEFFHFKASFKKIETLENLKNSNVKWTEEFKEDEQFDEVIESSDSNIYSEIFTRLHYETNPETDLILVKLDGSFSPKHSKGIVTSELVYKLRVTSSDISYLKVNEEIRAAVVDDSSRFKIFEININPLDFPYNGDDDIESYVDLFIQFTPCTGHLKYFLSDNLEDLFLEEQALVHSMLFPIMITNHTLKKGNDDRLNLEVIHKNSKIQHSFAKNQDSNFGLFQSDDNNESSDLIYLDQFGIQGKRLKNVQNLKNTKIYIGVRALSSIELSKKQEEFTKIYNNQGDLSNLKRRNKIVQKLPNYGAYLSSDQDVATFRISSYYLLNDWLDVLDKYELQNPSYGIIFEASGRGKMDKVKISWSPIISKNQTENLVNNITYKLLFAYSFDVAQIFQSTCELEFVQYYLEEKVDLKLEDENSRHLKACGSRILENQSLLDSLEQNLTLITVKNDNYVEVIPDGKLDKIKSIVVIAEIEEYDEDSGWDILYLPYSPVNFDKPIQLGFRHHRWFRILIITFIIALSVLLIFLIAYCHFRKRKSDLNAQSNNGISLSNIQSTHQQNDTHVSDESQKKTTIFDSERKDILRESGRSSVLDDPQNKKESDYPIEF